MDRSITKKGKIIYQEAKSLFMHHGIKKVSVEEICQKAGVSRMTFYKNFANKPELAYQIVKDIFDDAFLKYDEIFTKKQSFSEKVREVVLLKLALSKGFSMELVKDIYNSDIPTIQKLLSQMQFKSQELTTSLIEQGKTEGEINPSIPTKFIIYQMDMLIKEMQNEELFAMFESAESLTNSILQMFFYGIIKEGR